MPDQRTPAPHSRELSPQPAADDRLAGLLESRAVTPHNEITEVAGLLGGRDVEQGRVDYGGISSSKAGARFLVVVRWDNFNSPVLRANFEGIIEGRIIESCETHKILCAFYRLDTKLLVFTVRFLHLSDNLSFSLSTVWEEMF
jgi:hypothetical protein